VRRLIEQKFEQVVQSEGQHVLGWRTVPTVNGMLGETARSCEPFMRQVFIRRDPSITDELAFERKLYVIRKRAYNEIRTSTLAGAEYWYVVSLSCARSSTRACCSRRSSTSTSRTCTTR